MKNLLLSIACFAALSALPACKRLSCDKQPAANKPAATQPASQPATKA